MNAPTTTTTVKATPQPKTRHPNDFMLDPNYGRPAIGLVAKDGIVVAASSPALIARSSESRNRRLITGTSCCCARWSLGLGVALFVAALASAGTLLTALIVPLLSTSLTAVVTQYVLQGELPPDVSLFVDRMLGTSTQPLAAIAGVLVAAASLVLFTALTRDRDGAVATMRFTRYRDALAAAAAQESEPDTGRRRKSASELLRLLRHRA